METVFGYPVFTVNVSNAKFDRKKIIKQIEHNYKKDPTRDSFPFSNNHQEHKDRDNKNFKTIDYSSLLPIYNEATKTFFESFKLNKPFDYSYTIENYVATKRGQYMFQHVHPGCHFSAVHYLKFNPSIHPRTIFVNPNQVLPTYYSDYNPTFQKAVKPDTSVSFCMNHFSFDTIEDDITFFPNTLEHFVPLQRKKSNEMRITIVFNIYVKQKKEDIKRGY